MPTPGQIPTDFGIQAMTHWVYNGGSWLAPAPAMREGQWGTIEALAREASGLVRN